MTINKFKLLNVEINNISTDDLLAELDEGVLLTPNIDHMVCLQKDQSFYNCYKNAQFVVCDSRIIYLLTRIFSPSAPLKEQIAGSDFFPKFCSYHAEKNDGTKIFLLGGTPESVEVAKTNINTRTNSDIIAGTYSPPFGFESSDQENRKIYELIKASGANVLAVGVGAPKQEKWIQNHRQNLPSIAIFMGIGATIEFESGNLKRSPKWMTHFGLEWAYRLMQEPGRLAKRYLVKDTVFFWMLVKQKAGLYKNPWA